MATGTDDINDRNTAAENIARRDIPAELHAL
jgi:hypothetical protein